MRIVVIEKESVNDYDVSHRAENQIRTFLTLGEFTVVDLRPIYPIYAGRGTMLEQSHTRVVTCHVSHGRLFIQNLHFIQSMN